MKRIGYTILPIKMEQFLRGQDPENELTNLEIYSSLTNALEYMGQNQKDNKDNMGTGIRVLKVEIEEQNLRPTGIFAPPTAIGIADITPENTLDEAIQWTPRDMNAPLLMQVDINNWNATRENAWTIQEERFKERCLQSRYQLGPASLKPALNQEAYIRGVSLLVRNALFDYEDKCMDCEYDCRDALPKTWRRYEQEQLHIAIQMAGQSVMNLPLKNDLEKADAAVQKAHAAAIQYATAHGWTTFANTLQEITPTLQECVTTTLPKHIQTMSALRVAESIALAGLPEFAQYEAIQKCNQYLWESYKQDPAFEANLEKHAYSAFAKTLDQMSVKIPDDYLQEVSDMWVICSHRAIQQGASIEDVQMDAEQDAREEFDDIGEEDI